MALCSASRGWACARRRKGFAFPKGALAGIKRGAIGRQKPLPAVAGFAARAHRLGRMKRPVIQHHALAGPQGRAEPFSQVG